MTRIMDPPRDQFGKLPTPLTRGERQVIDLFDQELPAEWEIYVQPHLNGLRPDIVLLHPGVGVAVFEVKDWDLRAMRYEATTDQHGRCFLVARDRNGRQFSLESSNPIHKILLYEREIFELYCPRLDDRAGRAVITAGLVFPCSPRAEVERVFRPFIKSHHGMQHYKRYYPISGADDLSSGNIREIFPEINRSSSRYMNADTADDLRGWLREPFFSQEQRRPLVLDKEQRRLATTRTDKGYRRIKGPAGSGKSVVLAARAAELAAEGKPALVVSYNITLLNYLRDLAVRHLRDPVVRQRASGSAIRRPDFLNFHYWCKRVCSGNADEYKRLWAGRSDADQTQSKSVLEKDMALLVQRLYKDDAGRSGLPRYDAILVDEGQDFHILWWQTLRSALKKDGEMVLVADKTQNVYGTAGLWTDQAMKGAGFSGPWARLENSYRLPERVMPLVRRFAKDFLRGEEVDTPQTDPGDSQTEIALEEQEGPVELRWVQVSTQSNGLTACNSELRRMMKRLRGDTAIADVVFLSSSTASGRELVKMLEDSNFHVLHTFDEDERKSRRQKRAFFQGDARIKATTPHSFKGWEARHLVVFVESVKVPKDRALLYTALTRLRRHNQGSCLTVVCSCDELRTYGKSWPDYEEF